MRLALLSLAVVSLALPAAAQTVTVSGPGGSVTLQAADLAALPRRTVEARRDGKPIRWEGPTLEAILAKVGAPLGEAAKGPALAAYVVVEATDGFRTVLSFAEADPTFRGPGAVVADRLDGAPLSAAEGPLRLIVPGDLKPTRSVRNVAAIRLESVAAAPHPAQAGQSRIPSRP